MTAIDEIEVHLQNAMAELEMVSTYDLPDGQASEDFMAVADMVVDYLMCAMERLGGI